MTSHQSEEAHSGETRPDEIQSSAARLDAGSFRDREGRVFYQQGRVYRALSETALDAWRRLAASRLFARAQEAGTIVGTHEVDLDRDLSSDHQDLDPRQPDRQSLSRLGDWTAVLAHERVPFVSYPYEWPFLMLRDAALLTLDLLDGALIEDLTLKDASAYNVQWRGARPVFIDVASFEPWQAGRPWAGYRQFCQLFLYPLLLTAYRGVAFQPLLRGALDGIEPDDMRRLLRPRDRLRKGVLIDVDLQARIGARAASGDRPVRSDLERAGFKKELIQNNVRRLRKIVAGLTWRKTSSEWSDYAGNNTYTSADHEAKARFVDEAARGCKPALVFDLGANTGTFSRIAAAHAEWVVAVDIDPLAVERLYQSLRTDGPGNILPLIGNLADPAPALGWRHRERKVLESRGRPDLVLALALIHHLVITANIPLPEVVDHLADLGGELVIEWVAKDDPMVQRLLRNKDDIYTDYTLEVLEASLARRYEVVHRLPLESGTRTLLHARPSIVQPADS
jgi:SAM-dependent methyltransferase